MQHMSRWRVTRVAWQIAGLVALGTGIVGIVVPLLPTTVFLLLAAFCFCRGSQKLHDWLVTHRRFGPPIQDWRRHGAISHSAKAAAGIAIVATFAISLVLGAPGYVLGIQAVVLTAVAVFIFTRPAPPDDAGILAFGTQNKGVTEQPALSGAAAADD